MSPAKRERSLGPSCPRAEHGFTPSYRSAEHGFTLLEMLVALAIFSLAALALLRLEGATVSNMARLQDQAIAQMVARNLAVEAMTDPVPPSYGQQNGQELNGGRAWNWVRITERSPEPRIQQITIQVQGETGPEAATMVVFRRAAT